MNKELPTNYIPNREDRRRNRRSSPNVREMGRLGQELDYLHSIEKDITQRLTTEVLNIGPHATTTVFEGNAQAVYRWVDLQGNFYNLRRKLADSHLGAKSKPMLHIDEVHHYYSYQRNEVSLLDIENFDSPLSFDEIARINRFIHRPSIFNKPTKKEVTIIEAALFLAAMPFAQPESRRLIPKSVERLQRNLSSYLDYYVELIDNRSLSGRDEGNLAALIASVRGYLLQGISIYLPARLGISPSSVNKLLEHHSLREGRLSIWKQIQKGLESSLRDAYRKKVVPEDLAKFLQYFPLEDTRAANAVLRYLSDKNLDPSANPQMAEQSENSIKEFIKFQPVIQREIAGNKDRRIVLQGPQDSPFQGVTLTSQYEGTTIFILHLEGTHLTIEISKHGKVYGIPARLTKAYPEIQKQLMSWIIPGLILREKAKAPIAVKTEKQKYVHITNNKPDVLGPPVSSLKRKRSSMHSVQSKVEMPIGEEAPFPQRLVPYTESQIKSFMGARIRQEDIDLVMEAIDRFREGWKGAEPILSQRGANLYKIRAGDFRIALKHISGETFQVEFVANRKNFYERYDRNRS